MKGIITLLCFIILTVVRVQGQDDINQLIIVNGGQFGNPTEQTNIAAFNPTTMEYDVFDTIPVNSVQHILIEGDYAYVAAQNYIVKYDLDTYERLAIVEFPGLSTHQIALTEEYLFATNFYGQTSDNLYVFNKDNLMIIDTVSEISSPGGTMVLFNDRLFIGQNNKGNTDLCPPFGCLNDTSGYLAEVDISTHQFIQNYTLNNNGSETGRLLASDISIFSLNEASNTITEFNPANGQSITNSISNTISTARYRNEGILINNEIVSLFDGGIGALSTDLQDFQMIVDTPAIAFAFDYLNDEFYIISTDFFSFSNVYAFDGDGTFNYEFPIGDAPEAIAIHYNNRPVGTNYETSSADTVIIPIGEIAFDVDGDEIYGNQIVDAPANGAVNFLPNGDIMYRSFSVGSADNFRVEICDDKLNPLCTFLNVNITATTPVIETAFESVKIFPNPTTKYITIGYPVPGSIHSLYNAVGELVLKFESDKVDVSFLPTNNYFIKIENEGNFITLPFIKY